jgi:hypothetical protein
MAEKENLRKRKNNDNNTSDVALEPKNKNCRAITKLNYVKIEKEEEIKHVSITAPSSFPIKEFFAYWFQKLSPGDTTDPKMIED